jgi:hypothetical protein
MIERWQSVLTERAGEWSLPAGDGWDFLFHNNHQPGCSTINVLWFHRKGRYPAAVSKLCRQSEALAAEFANLKTVYGEVPRHSPRPLDLVCMHGFWTLWMTGVPGMRIPPRNEYPASVLVPVVDMISSVHRTFRRQSEGDSAVREERLVRKPLDALTGFGTSEAVREGCARLAGSSSVRLQGLPSIVQHGDLFLDNILHDGRDYRIVDWETFGAIDLPFYDLFTVLLSITRGSAETPDRANPAVLRQIPALVERYADALALPRELAPGVLPLTLANWFYLHWLNGRQAIMHTMYGMIDHYFRHRNEWNEALFGRVSGGHL